jgi:hypothetical protein
LLLALLALAGTIVFGDAASRMIEQNIAELTSNDLEQLDRGDSRRKIWAADLEGVREFPLVGSGLGSHSETYWLWYNHPGDGKEYSHAENGPLQIALETGLTGLGLAGLLWLIVLLWCAQGLWNVTTPRGVAAATAAAAGLLMNLAHSAVDFVWYVPACMNLALMYAVIAWRTSLMRFSESQRGDAVPAAGAFSLPRLAWLAAVPAVLALGAWMVQEKLPELAAEPVWQDYLRLTYAQQSAKGDEFSAAETLLQRRIKLALAAAQANPRAHRMQLHAGLACLRQFALNQQQAHSQMPLAQIRDAARTLFNSPDEMQAWLNRPGVLGAGRSLIEEAISHFRASLKECPLQPRPYLELAELTWLEGQSEAQERALIEQAVTARPYDGRAQFALGRMLWLAGAQREGIVHWQNSFRLDSSYRDQLIQSLAAYVPARFFLENFEPDHTALVQLRGAYRGSEDRAGYQAVVETLARSAVKEAVSADGLVAERNWLLAHECFDELADAKGAYHSAREAIAANPSSFPAHRALAIWLYKNGHYRESTEQLNWCRQRQPEAEWLTKLLQDALQRAEPSVPKAYAEGPSGVRR